MSRSLGAMSLTTRSPIFRFPSEISSRPAIIRRLVVFPQPEGPTSTMNSPSPISRLRSFTAWKSPYILLTFSNVTVAMAEPPRPVVHRGPMHPADEAETRTGPIRGHCGVTASYGRCHRGARQPSPCRVGHRRYRHCNTERTPNATRLRSLDLIRPPGDHARGICMLQIRSRSRKTLAAIAAAALLCLSGGVALAFTALPSAADHGLQRATDAAGKTVPVRAVPEGVPAVDETAPHTPDAEDAQNEDAPPTDTHGAAVSA